MKGNFDRSLKMMLAHEGGYVCNPRDPGGMTNLGVTKATWEAYVDHDVTESEMRALTAAKVAPLYKTRYWDAVRGDELPSGVDYAMFDFAVNSGPVRAIRTLQSSLAVTSDGMIGPRTLKAASMSAPDVVIDNLCRERVDFLARLSTYKTFGRGWIRRVNEVEVQAKKMAAQPGA
jgi:lysozyme family protein